MAKTRVLVVEDSVVMRRLIADVIDRDPELTTAGTAQNGVVALAKMQTLVPDIVTLDVEMPELDGLGTLRELRKLYPDVPVIMFSTVTERCASATLEALALGASDYVTKPSKVANLAAAMHLVEQQLVPKLKLFAGRRRVSPAPMRVFVPASTATVGSQAVRAVCIGVSTGGPSALARVLPSLPANLPVPVFIVQHMPPTFTRLLAERLQAGCALRVCEAAPEMKAEPGCAYIAPGDYHMVVAAQGTEVRVRTLQTAPEHFCRPAVDVLFRSVADVYGPSTLAIVLTGMGSDGLRGAEEIRERGGTVIAQDQASSVVWGMPGAVVGAGVAHVVLPIDQVAPEILARVARGHQFLRAGAA